MDKEFLYQELIVNDKSYKTVANEIGCNVITLTKWAKKLGVGQTKSHIIRVPESISDEYKMDFVRGYFDGDGSIEMYYPSNKFGVRPNKPQLRLRIFSGSPMLLEDLADIIHNQSNGEIEKKMVSQRHKGKNL